MRRSLAAGSFLVLAAVAAGPVGPAAQAQDPAKKLTVRWFGQSYFQVETSAGKKIVFDPHAIPEFGRPVVQADIITCSHWHSDHSQPEAVENAKAARVFMGLLTAKKGRIPDWAKFDEKVGAIRVRSFPTYHDADTGLTRGKNSAFIIEADGLTVCHLGDLGHELTKEQVKALGPVDILMIPVGGVYTINGEQARAVAKAINPRLYVLPMHYGVPGYDELLPADEFLEGQKNVKRLPLTNELVVPTDMKADGFTTVLLGWKKDDAPPKK